MKKKIVSALLYIIFFFNTNLLKAENSEVLKVGLLAPLTGEYKELGNSLLYSLQLALEEINDENILIIPRDTGFKDKKKLNTAIQEIISKGANVIIGPISNEDFSEVKKYSDVTFISPSNIRPEFSNNIISVGISLESQLISLEKFLIKNKKNINNLIKKYQIIIDASDNFNTKFLLNEKSIEFKKKLIVGAISKFDGHIFVFNFKNQKTACLRCFYQEKPSDQVLNCDQEGILGTTANIVGSLQANEILKSIIGSKNVLENSILILNTLTLRVRIVKFNKIKKCICEF